MLNQNIDIIAQEYVGNHRSEYTIEVTSDENSKIMGNIIIRRNFDSSISYKNKMVKDGKK